MSLWNKVTYLLECVYHLFTKRYTTRFDALDLGLNVYGKYLFVNINEIQDAPTLMLFAADCGHHG